MNKFFEELKYIAADIRNDLVTRCVYSIDASIFEIMPKGVVLPKNKTELQKIVRIAYQNNVPVIPRGAATGITGGCLGDGLAIDTSKHLNKILSINREEHFVICEPGVIQDDLNAELAKIGYRLGPDTSTGNRATLGGMAANNAAGARSLKYGRMVDHVLEVELLLSNGEFIQFAPLSNSKFQEKCLQNNREGQIYRTIKDIIDNEAQEIENRFPKIPRRVSGYNLDELIKEPLNLSKLIVGSEGTLGIITEIKLNIVPLEKKEKLFLLYFDDIFQAMEKVPEILKYHPTAVELIDEDIIELGRASPSLRGQLNWLKENAKAILIIESEQTIPNSIQITDENEIKQVWGLRKAGLGILLSKRTFTRAIAFVEDLSVDPYKLAPFMKKFCAYLESKGKRGGIYGHVGSGCMHLRPYINLQKNEELALMRQMMLDISALLLEYGGALSGEHGDGLIRSWLNPKMFGERIIRSFEKIKLAFDPENLMNPGKIVFAKEPFNQLRFGPIKSIHTFLNFESEEGFELAVDLCNGNGQCRKKEGVMCPSFQVTHDEFHSTRARAQALRGIIHGKLPDLTSQGMYDVMDLCLSCKGCKTECPSQIDMAKMKSEFLYHYHQKHGTPLRDYLFGNIGTINKVFSQFPAFFNGLQNSWFSKQILNWIGISPKRTLPTVASYRFSDWFRSYKQPKSKKKVILFNDTFTEFNDPSIGEAGVQVLNKLGYEVIVYPWSCCGRPLISKGLLEQAKKKAENILKLFDQDLPIIGLEPSCILTIKDDYPGLIAGKKLENCVTFDEFLFQHQGILKLSGPKQNVLVHGHCYQKSLIGMEKTLKFLNSVGLFNVKEIRSGCCGMAGSFGYESEHYDISMKIGDLHLFPEVKKDEKAWIIANGTSCRHQILDGTGRKAFHISQLINYY